MNKLINVLPPPQKKAVVDLCLVYMGVNAQI